MNLNKEYWEQRYKNQQTGWDTGTITTPLKNYFDQIENKNIKILIPGAGNAYEYEYLLQQGFTDVTVIDIAKQPLENIKQRVSCCDEDKLIEDDFFNHNQTYDLIVEQTFFCALAPILRKEYAKKVHSLLNTNGKLAGLLFQFPLTESGPPFGGSLKEYVKLFSPLFDIKIIETAYNSIKPRHGNELFFIFTKK